MTTMNTPHPTQMNALELLQSSSLTTVLQQEIERMILSGEIDAGTRLNESELAQRFGTSRGPIREALRGMTETGLVRLEKNRGVFVREVSIQEADEIYDVREALDELVGRTLARRITDDQLQEIGDMLDQMDQLAIEQDVTAYHRHNLRFHDHLLNLTGNRKLIEVYGRLIKELHLFRLRGLHSGGGIAVSNAEHREIVAAIASRDPERAGQAMRSHVQASRARIHRAVEQPAPAGQPAPPI